MCSRKAGHIPAGRELPVGSVNDHE
uniref:Uncharacterized protein n=1 Tax=Anguilla anguilla TaxID=7936 RepID=A0A0E9VBT7_ANGAN